MIKRWRPTIYKGGGRGDGKSRGRLRETKSNIGTGQESQIQDNRPVDDITHIESAVPKLKVSRNRVAVRGVRSTWWKGYYMMSITVPKPIYEIYSMFFRSVCYVILDLQKPVSCQIFSCTIVGNLVVIRIRSESLSWRSYWGMRKLVNMIYKERPYIPKKLEFCDELTYTIVPII